MVRLSMEHLKTIIRTYSKFTTAVVLRLRFRRRVGKRSPRCARVWRHPVCKESPHGELARAPDLFDGTWNRLWRGVVVVAERRPRVGRRCGRPYGVGWSAARPRQRQRRA